jgi:tetratricopeptide (TPR) repeat protein
MIDPVDRERRSHEIFREISALPEADRKTFLDLLKREEPDTARRVLQLLSAADRSQEDSFLDPRGLRVAAANMGGFRAAGLELPGAADELPAPVRVGRYRIVRELGRGGMAVVYQAERDDGTYEQSVALKILRAGLHGEDAIARFAQERQILASLEHPLIARILDGGVAEDGRPYLVMEHVDGLPLDEFVAQHGLSRPSRLELFAGICDAVAHAHRRLIVHRDLKPGNIIVTHDGSVRLLDFGIAKLLDPGTLPGAAAHTRTELRVLTPSYASPEQLRGEPISTASDVYQLGLLLYELLTGTRAQSVEGRSPGELERAICETDPARPSAAASDPVSRRALRGELDWITMKALEKDPARRYESPADLGADIRRHLASEPVSAGPPGTAYRARKFVGRHPFEVLAATTGLVLLIAFAVTMAVQARRIAGERDRAERARSDLELVAEFQTDMLSEVDPRGMGRWLEEEMRKDIEEATRARGMPEPEVASFLGSYEASMQGINLTNTARQIIDRNILDRAAATLDERFAERPAIDARLRATIAETYRELGMLDRAEPHFQAALKTRRRLLGDDDPATLDTMNRLATVYRSQGRYDEAEPLLVETWETQKRVLGDEHPDTLEACNGLALVYWSQGRYPEAEPLFLQVLETRKRLFGHDDEATLQSQNNLAGLYFNQGKYDQAEPLLADTVEAKKRVLGDEDPDTLRSLNNLALVYLNQGRFDEAEPLYREVVETHRRVLGDEHPSTLRAMHNLGLLYRRMRRFDDAERLDLETLEMEKRSLGDNHPDTLGTLFELATLYGVDQDRYDEAEPLFLQVLGARKRSLGDDHPATLATMNNLAQLYWNQGRQEEAESLLVETLEAKKRALGDDHPSTLNSMSNLSEVYREQGRFDQAEPLARKTLEARKRVLGESHPRTLATMTNLAALYRAQGLLEQARSLLLEALAGRTLALGEDHEDTLDTAFQVARLEAAQGDLPAALDRLRQAVDAGFAGAESMESEPDLEPLRDRPEFGALVEGARRNAAALAVRDGDP